MKLVSNCEQVLTTRYSRRLITMEKVAPYDAASAEAHYAALGPPIMAIDQMHDEVYAHYESTADGGTAKQKVPPPAIVNNRKPFRSKKT